ncbi:MAG TPA: UDP-2,3-diacylglucosamine diphosphatase [Nevskiaceae bacterium]|nr:UDP-2,3-diacylglucosamine diphosphatase [Nevskiaceae bacterium]
MSTPRSNVALLLADLHLPAGPSPFREAFLAFCKGPAREAADVYILGDLFEYWIGDDVGMSIYADETVALLSLTKSGARVHFAHGNRDFLVGDNFFEATGAQRMDDPTRVELGGVATLISHGDELCTDDVAYQRWRRFCRWRNGQKVFVALPRSFREWVAGGVRKTSLVEKRSKADDIMDVNDGAVRDAFRRSGVTRIIHGHTHRPGEQHYEIEGRDCERIVLADWRPERMEYLRVDESGAKRIAL